MDLLVAPWAHSTSSFKWSSLRSSPSVIRCTPGVGFRTDPVPYFYKRLAGFCSRTTVSCIGTYIQFRTVWPCKKTSLALGQWEADWQMKFNVAKCHSMRVTRHQHHKHTLFDYSLHNQTLETLENAQLAKYLGITISDNMDWAQHISEISPKATKTLGFLRRNLAFS